MHGELYYWRKTIAGIMLFGVVFYALIPSFGMAAHRFLPPHEHFFMNADQAAMHEHEEEDLMEQESIQVDDCLVQDFLPNSGQHLVHNSADASGIISAATAIGLDSSAYLVMPDDFVARLNCAAPRLESLFLSPLEPPPNALTVS